MMLSPGKRIYTKRYPQPEFIEPDKKTEKQLQSVKATTLWPEFKEHLREIEENTAYVFRPDKLEGLRRFIDLAKKLSLDCKIDMDIWEYEDSFSVVLYLHCCDYRGAAKDMFSDLLKLCDCVSITPTMKGPFDMMLLLDYRTHDCYLSGRKVE